MLTRLYASRAPVVVSTTAKALRATQRTMGSAGAATAVVHADVLRTYRDHTLVPLLSAKKTKLAELEAIKTRCDASKELTGDRYMFALYLFLITQCIVLFDWTYIHFDWTLTEPITYLIGYSATWIGLWWYGNMQREFSFDNFRSYVTSKRRDKLYKANKLDMVLYEQLRVDVAELEARVKTLRSM